MIKFNMILKYLSNDFYHSSKKVKHLSSLDKLSQSVQERAIKNSNLSKIGKMRPEERSFENSFAAISRTDKMKERWMRVIENKERLKLDS